MVTNHVVLKRVPIQKDTEQGSPDVAGRLLARIAPMLKDGISYWDKNAVLIKVVDRHEGWTINHMVLHLW